MAGSADRWSGTRRRQRRLTAAILVVGLVSAILIFVFASPPPPNPLGYEPLETKSYVHDLEVYGGKWNVLAEEFRDWFAGLWHGRTLAFTVAVITLLLAGGVRIFGTPVATGPHAVRDRDPDPDR